MLSIKGSNRRLLKITESRPDKSEQTEPVTWKNVPCVRCGALVLVGLNVPDKEVFCIEHDKGIKAL